MKHFLARYWFLILLAFLATVLFLIRSFFQTSPLPLVTMIKPKAGQLSTSPEKIEVEFRQGVDFAAADFQLIAIPEIQFKLEKKKNVLIINLIETFLEEEKYLLELRFKNQPLYSWSYFLAVLPTPLPEKKAGFGRGDPNAFEKIEKETLNDYPLIKLMPHETEDYYLNYVSPLILGIKLKKGEQEEVKKQVLLWLEEKAGGLEKHQLVWFD